MTSKLDAVYRSFLITKFFTKGWGKPENLRRLFEFRKIVANRDECFKLIESDYPVTITKDQKLSDCHLVEGYFESPLERYLPGIVPKVAQQAHFQALFPLQWPKPDCKPVCLHLAGTGDHFFWRRRNLMVKPLIKEAGIGGIILENPFYGLRKPIDQVRSSLHNVSDIFVMGGCLILESLVLFHWCERNGFGPLGVTGLSMGGHMASLAATNWPKPLVLVPCLSWSTASAVFLQGVMAHSINWDLLEDQYLADVEYREKLAKMVTVVDEAFLAGKKFARTFSEKVENTELNQTDVNDKQNQTTEAEVANKQSQTTETEVANKQSQTTNPIERPSQKTGTNNQYQTMYTKEITNEQSPTTNTAGMFNANQSIHANVPSNQNTYGNVPFNQNPYGNVPFNQNPFGNVPFNQNQVTYGDGAFHQSQTPYANVPSNQSQTPYDNVPPNQIQGTYGNVPYGQSQTGLKKGLTRKELELQIDTFIRNRNVEVKKLLDSNKISQSLYAKLTSNEKFELDLEDIEYLIKCKVVTNNQSQIESPQDNLTVSPKEMIFAEISNNPTDTKAESERLPQFVMKHTENKIIEKPPQEEVNKEKHKPNKTWNVSITPDWLTNFSFSKSKSGKKIDISKIHWRDRETLQFMRGIMDECTHLSNFTVPFDTSLIIAVCAKHDAYVPRDDTGRLEEIWPGAEVRYVDAGHVSAYILHQSLFRSCIVEAFERSNKRWKDGKHVD